MAYVIPFPSALLKINLFKFTSLILYSFTHVLSSQQRKFIHIFLNDRKLYHYYPFLYVLIFVSNFSKKMKIPKIVIIRIKKN